MTCGYFVKWVGEKPPTHVAFDAIYHDIYIYIPAPSKGCQLNPKG